LSAGLPLPKALYVHGFITADGQKMSKTVGNVIDPFGLVKKYGVDTARYFLLREIPSGEDGDFSYKKLEGRYNADLANTYGNLVSRTLALIDKHLNGELIYEEDIVDKGIKGKIADVIHKYHEQVNNFSLHEAAASAFSLLDIANAYIDEKKPWALVKEDEASFLAVMTTITKLVLTTSWLIYPFIPETSEKVFDLFGAENKFPPEGLDERKFAIKPDREVLFPKINV
jgi:methionyl-tRNA synthetase